MGTCHQGCRTGQKSSLHRIAPSNKLYSTWWDVIILVSIAIAIAGMAPTVGAISIAIRRCNKHMQCRATIFMLTARMCGAGQSLNMGMCHRGSVGG
jgi:hypothetical protein